MHRPRRLPLLLILLGLLPAVARALLPPPRFPGPHARPRPRAGARDGVGGGYEFETRYFRQRLDHFSFSGEEEFFQQRYLVGRAGAGGWAGPGGPIFFYCGNEGDIAWFAANSGLVWDAAPRFAALVVFAEHRYYGESMPFGSKDKAYNNSRSMAYLTAEQALADYAVLLTDLKRNLSSESSPVVLFGGSYGGMLAAWMRLKYPHIAVGALASSAPILQFEDIVPDTIFYDLVSNDFKRESLSCFQTIKDSWKELDEQGNGQDGLLKLSKTLHLCQTLNTTGALSDWLNSAYSYLAMVDYPMPSEFLMPLPANPIKEACTEMVMPMSSSEGLSMFPPDEFDYALYADDCVKNFGVRPRPRWISTEFGGHNISSVLEKFGSNIIFFNGLLDPWSGGGVLKNISESVVAIVAPLGAHHIDLRPATKEDPDWLVSLRESELEIISGWLSDHYRGRGGAIFQRATNKGSAAS
ncbi:uncharacterized protein [Aegilops tauschii subsp. strangulata]|uniref:uncharacterized protein isoform X2 n=1 Tax=Aegilops tauschii subsp. strangulata TaxID=200361 RepID=UPI001ABC8A54|nr:lysosomal Pro-X carboxypeptidase isoform X2 [Aegilops tauschii subsp. strangulata]